MSKSRPDKSKIRKLEESDDSDSGPDDKGPISKKPKQTTSSPKAKSGGDDDENVIMLSKNRFVSVREFRGKVMVDIREFYDAGGEMKPGKKGIALSIEQWNALQNHLDDINAAVKRLA